MLVGLDGRCKPVEDAADHRCEITGLMVEIGARRDRVGICERAEIIDEPAQPQHVVVHLDGPVQAGSGDAVDHLLAVALQQGEWGPQFVGDVCVRLRRVVSWASSWFAMSSNVTASVPISP